MNNDTVILHLDRPRVVKYNHTALKILEELTGKKITEIDEQMDLMDHELREQMVYCGLLKDAKDNNESLTLERVVELLDDARSLADVLKAIVRAWRITFGAELTDSEGNQPAATQPPKNPKNSTGRKTNE